MFLLCSKWQSTPAQLPGKSHGLRSLISYSPWGRKELDTTERLHFHFHFNYVMRASQVSPVVKNLPATAGDAREAGSVPGSRRSPGEGNGNPLPYSCLGKSHGQRSLAGYIVYRVAKSQTMAFITSF